MRPRRQVEQLLRERLGEVLEDVLLADHADDAAGRRRRSGRCGSARRRTGRSRRGRSARGGAFAARRFISVSTGASRSTWPPTITPKMSRSVRTPAKPPGRRRSRRPNRRSRSARRARRHSPRDGALGHGQRIAPLDDPERLAGERGNPAETARSVRLSHPRSVVRSRRHAARAGRATPTRPRRRPALAGRSALLGSAGGSPAARRGRARARLGGLVRLGCPVRQAGLRDGRRLADPARLAVPDRGRAGLGVARGVGRAGGAGLRRLPRRRIVVALGLGVLYLGQRRDVLRRARDGLGLARRADRVHLPGDRRRPVAAGRASTRRPPAVARPGDGPRRHGTGARRDPGRRRAAVERPDPGHRFADHLLGLDRPLGPAGRARRPNGSAARPRTAPTRPPRRR